VFRGPNGAAARVGAQHSQDYSAWYSHDSGPEGVAPYSAADAKGLLKAAIRDPNPVIFLENEILYGQTGDVPKLDDFVLPIGKARIAASRQGRHAGRIRIGMTYALKAAENWPEGRHRGRDDRSAHAAPAGYETVIESGEEDQPLRHRGGRLAAIGVGGEIAARSWSAHSTISMRRCACARQGRADALCRQPRKAGAAECRRSRRGGESRHLSLRGNGRMPINITMPALSPTMEEGNLAKWL
jgi:hypothetical protein